MSQRIWIITEIAFNFPINNLIENVIEDCRSLIYKFNDGPPPGFEEERLEGHVSQTLAGL